MAVGQGPPDTGGLLAFESPLPLPAAFEDPSPGTSFLLSAILPGAGQYLQGRRRWVGYVAAEAAGWVFWSRARSRAQDFQDQFRDLAWETARTWQGARIDGEWEYYERMEKFVRSGAFDRDPGTAGLQPEEDPTTFNGDAWRLARQIHLGGATDAQPGDPAYEEALEFYRERAVGAVGWLPDGGCPLT